MAVKETSRTQSQNVPRRPGLGAFSDFMEGGGPVLQPYLPSELVGGAIPCIPGTEDEAVWNAASQACGTERVHYCYTISEGRCWYLATPSSCLAGNPDSWCPLAAALPGNSEFWDRETIYLYEQEGSAGALRWEAETGRMQVFLGAARTILPRIQSMEANFATINPEVAKPVPWRNRALRQEKLSRIIVKAMLFSGIGVTLVSLLLLLGSYMAANVLSPQLDRARQASAEASNQLMVEASNALQSSTNKHLSRIIELYDTIGGFGGVLVKYEVKADGGVEWQALIPGAVSPGQLQATAIGAEDGRIRIKGTN
jgi:hypothetical protein